MKAAVYDRNGDPSVLRYVEVPDPAIGSTDVLIETKAISVEGGDVINRRMTPPPAPGHIVGYASAGIVVAVGEAVTTRKIGDRVTCFADDGSHATLRSVSESQTWLIPDGIGFEAAAVLPISFGTAHHTLFARGGLQRDETVLIQGGAGGVGLAAIQLAKCAGATVIAVASGEERLCRLTELGADHVIDHRKEVLDLAGRVDLVIDPVGTTLAVSLRALAPEGRLVFVGNTGGGRLEVDLWPALQANQSLLGVFMGTQFANPQVAATVDVMLADVAVGRLRVQIDRSFPLARAPEAHDHAERGKPFGRVVMTPD